MMDNIISNELLLIRRAQKGVRNALSTLNRLNHELVHSISVIEENCEYHLAVLDRSQRELADTMTVQCQLQQQFETAINSQSIEEMIKARDVYVRKQKLEQERRSQRLPHVQKSVSE